MVVMHLFVSDDAISAHCNSEGDHLAPTMVPGMVRNLLAVIFPTLSASIRGG